MNENIKSGLRVANNIIDGMCNSFDDITDDELNFILNIRKALDSFECQCDYYYGFNCGCGERIGAIMLLEYGLITNILSGFEDEDNWLNEHGLVVVKHKTNKHLFLERSYHWVPRITFLDESDGRKVISFNDINIMDFEGFVTKEEYNKVSRKYHEIYNL